MVKKINICASYFFIVFPTIALAYKTYIKITFVPESPF